MNEPSELNAPVRWTLRQEPITEAICTISNRHNIALGSAKHGTVVILDWSDGALRLTGDADEGARLFAVHLGNHLSQKLQDYEAALVSLDREPGVAAVLAKWRSTT